MSPHFRSYDSYANIMMTELHPPTFWPYATPFPTGSNSDPSMMMLVYTVKLDPSKATPLHMIHLDSEVTSFNRRSRVSRCEWE